MVGAKENPQSKEYCTDANAKRGTELPGCDGLSAAGIVV
jgi:hypothetical protein